MTDEARQMRLLIHHGWWVIVACVAVGSIALGRPVLVLGNDWSTAFNIEVAIASLSVVPAIVWGKRWADLFVILTGFHFCLRLGALVFDESANPLPPKSRALAALLYGGYTVSLLATRFTYQLMEGVRAK